MHLVQRCHSRFPLGGLIRFWNEAADCVVNQALLEAHIEPREEMQEMSIGYKEEWEKYKGWVTEAIYYDLIKEAKDQTECPACKQIAEQILGEHQQRSQSGNGSSNDEGKEESDNSGEGGDQKSDSGSEESDQHGDGCSCGCEDMPEHTCRTKGMSSSSGVTSDKSQGNEDGDAEAIHRMERGIAGAAEGLERGSLPGAVQRMLEELVKPSVTWKDIIRSKASSIFGKGRYTQRRPGRRSMATGVRFPRRDPENVGALIWLDTSGSISPAAFRQFASECLGILTQTGCDSILVGCHDVNAYSLTEVKCKEDILGIEYRGGGTSHLDVFEVVEGKKGAEGIELPKGYTVGMVVCLTDMMSEFPPDCNYETVWGIPSEYFHTDSRYGCRAKFGREVEVTIDARK
jgi:predicted metal-dependent peptidase